MIKGLIRAKSIKNTKKDILKTDVQSYPVLIKNLDNNDVHHLKIDKAIKCESKAIIIGLCSFTNATFITDDNSKIDKV